MREELDRLVNMLRSTINVLPDSKEKSQSIIKLAECYMLATTAINNMESKNQEEKENDEQ